MEPEYNIFQLFYSLLAIIMGIIAGRLLRRKLESQYQTPTPYSLDYNEYLRKFIKITHMQTLDVFKLARDETGFGFDDKQVEAHLDKYVKTGELPNYVEIFLDKGIEKGVL